MFDYSVASLVLFDAKRPYTVLAHNKYYQELWDEPFRTQGMVGKNLLDYVPAAEQSGVMAVYDEVVQTKQARNLLGFPYDGMPRGKTWWNWHLSPVLKDGEVIALAHMGIDVTREFLAMEESQRLAKEAEEGKNTLDALMACIPEGITIASAPDVVTTMLSRYGSELLLRGWETAKDLSMEDWLAKVEHYLSDGRTPATAEDLPLLRAVKYGETIEGKELNLRRPTGDWLPVLCNAAPIRDSDGNITGGIVAWRDITGRKKMEDELRESEIRFRTMANSIPQLAWIARADGFIFWYNQRWYDYTGTTPEQMEGWGWQSVHDPKVLPEVTARWKTAIATGEPFDMEFPLLGADKIFRPFLTRVLPVKDEQGRVIQWFGTNTDLSERKRAEEELALNEREFRLLAESMPQIVWTTRADGWNTYFNQKWVDYTGLTLEESYGHGWNKPFHPDDQQRAWNAWQNAVSAQRTLFASVPASPG